MIDLARRFARIRGGPLSGRLGVGILSAGVGVIAFYAIGRLIDHCHAFAAFYPVVQIAGLAGGLVAAGVVAVASTLVAYFSGEPFADFWTGALLVYGSAALAGLAGESLRRASEGAAREPRPAEQRGGEARAETTRIFESVAATIAHDIAQPLAAAAAYLQTVRRLLASETGVRGSSVAGTVDKAAAQLARAGRLVTRMREFLAHGPPRLAAVPLHALLLEAIGPRAGADAPQLRLDAQCDLVLADATQLEQLFIGLLRAAATAARLPERLPAIATSSTETALIVTVALGDLDGDALDGRTADLSLWRATVEAHHGAFRAEPAEQGVLTIEITLPLVARGG